MNPKDRPPCYGNAGCKYECHQCFYKESCGTKSKTNPKKESGK